MRVVALGPEAYFAYRWNNLDAFLILLNVLFFFISTNSNIDNLFVICRMFRVGFLFRTFFNSEFFQDCHSEILSKLRRLF